MVRDTERAGVEESSVFEDSGVRPGGLSKLAAPGDGCAPGAFYEMRVRRLDFGTEGC